MSTMKALRKTKPEPGVTYCEVPKPVCKPDEVLVQVKAVGICGSDVHIYEWTPNYEHTIPYMPYIMGHEYAGVIVEVGSEVKERKVGDRVVCRPFNECGHCHYCKSGQRFYCLNGKTPRGLCKDGAYAEYCAMQEDEVVPMPDSMSFEQGALVEPGIVTCSAVIDSRINFGDFCVIQGPGPIGLMTLLFAKAYGAGRCVVVGTKRDKLRLELAKELGADYVLLGDEVNVVEEVQKLTGGYGADIVFECTGVPAMVQTALDSVVRSGKVVLVGIYPKAGEINLTTTVRNAKQLIGTYSDGIAWEKLIDWMGSDNYYARQMTKLITHRSHLEDADAAFHRCINKENCKEMFIFD